MASFKIALRFLKSGRAQTVLIVIGIAVALSVQVFVGSLIGSLQASLIDTTVGHSPQVTVVSARDNNVTIEGWSAMVTRIQGVGGVRAVAVSASSNAFAEKGGKVAPAVLRGFDFADADRIYGILGAIYNGTAPATVTDCLIGKQLGQDLNVGVGGNLTIVTSFGTRENLTISGLFDLGVASVNEGWVLTRLDAAQGIFRFQERVTSIEIGVTDVFKADTVAADIAQVLSNPDVKVQNWKEQNQALLSGLQAQSISSNMIQAFILVSVIITIASVLSITVLQKSRQIGILKAMGIKDRAASLIFLYEGLLLGLGGTVLGILLGAGLATAFSTFTKGAAGGSLIEISIDPMFLVASFAIAMISSAIAGVLPARRSSRLSPIDVIRGS